MTRLISAQESTAPDTPIEPMLAMKVQPVDGTIGGFRESKAIQLRVDLNRLHATIIPSRVEAPSVLDPVRDITSWPDDGSRLSGPFPRARFPANLRTVHQRNARQALGKPGKDGLGVARVQVSLT